MMEVAWPSDFHVLRDQRLGDTPARRLACVPTAIRFSEVSASATPSAAELVPNAKAVDQIISALGESATAGLIDCPGATIQHGRNLRTIGVIRICMGAELTAPKWRRVRRAEHPSSGFEAA
jgi:hypothetical protein